MLHTHTFVSLITDFMYSAPNKEITFSEILISAVKSTFHTQKTSRNSSEVFSKFVFTQNVTNGAKKAVTIQYNMLYCTLVWRCQRNIWTTWAYSVFAMKLKPQEITFYHAATAHRLDRICNVSLANYVLL